MEVKNISPYLTSAPDVLVSKRSTPLATAIPAMSYGSKPSDGGHLHLTPDEQKTIVAEHQESELFIRRLIGSQEMLKNIERYCLWIHDDDIDTAKKIAPISARLELVRLMRLSSKKKETNELSATPHKFEFIAQAMRQKDYVARTLVIPLVSSENRDYLPTAIYNDGEIVSASAFMILNPELWHLAILSSTMHCCWLNAVGGKLEDRYRYSNTLVWNTFPLPPLTDNQISELNATGQAILNARKLKPGVTLGDMYTSMHDELLAAHRYNDAVIERIFRDEPFTDDNDRLTCLFERYAAMKKARD